MIYGLTITTVGWLMVAYSAVRHGGVTRTRTSVLVLGLPVSAEHTQWDDWLLAGALAELVGLLALAICLLST